MAVKRWKFEKPEDISAYWEHLRTVEMDYHLDDLPSEVFEKERIGIVQMTVICANHDDLTEFCRKEDIEPMEFVVLNSEDELKEKYLRTEGLLCPVCNSNDLETGSKNYDTRYHWQSIECQGCGATWDDVYTLTGMENFVRGEK